MMEQKPVDLKTESSEKLGLMLGETAMSIGQLHQNYLAIADEIRSRIPIVQVGNQDNENKDNA